MLPATSPVGETISVSTPSGPISMPTIGLGTAFGFTPPASTDVVYNATKLWLEGGGRSIHSAWMSTADRTWDLHNYQPPRIFLPPALD